MAVTIKEIASECGVSEQAVRAWCRRNHVAKDAKGSFAISETIKTAIYQHYRAIEGKEVSQHAKASCETCETSETVLISMLQKELDLKNKQLAVKDKQIEELNARLAEVVRLWLQHSRLHRRRRLFMLGRFSSSLPGRSKWISRDQRQNKSGVGLRNCFEVKSV